MADQDIKIEHRLATNYASHSATGAILSGPSPDGFLHLTFFSDRIRAKTETGNFVEKGRYTTTVNPDDLESFREDAVSVALSIATVKELSVIFARRSAEIEKENAGG
jgi:hypothetical protein